MSFVLTERIEIDPAVMMGKPVIRGTRIPVELIIRKLGQGATEADLLDAYPRLTREDIPGLPATATEGGGVYRRYFGGVPSTFGILRRSALGILRRTGKAALAYAADTFAHETILLQPA